MRHPGAFDILTGLRKSSAGLAQLVEQLFRKQQVCGSSPQVGSRLEQAPRPMWRNRQTRYVQGVVGVTPWEFESPPRHQAACFHGMLLLHVDNSGDS